MRRLESRFGWSVAWFAGVFGAVAVEACGSGFSTATNADGADGSSGGTGATNDGGAGGSDGSAGTGGGANDGSASNDATTGGGGSDGSVDAGTTDSGGDGSGRDASAPDAACVDDCSGQEYLALAGAPVNFLAANSIYTVWVENQSLIRECTFDAPSYVDAGSPGTAVDNVRDLAVDSNFAFVAEPAQNNTHLVAINFAATLFETSDTTTVTSVTTLGSSVYDIASGNLESNTESLNAEAPLTNPTTPAGQVRGAGSWLYYTDPSNFLYACSPGGTGGCNTRYPLFQGPNIFVFAVNQNRNIFWFDQQGNVKGCTFDNTAAAPGYGCSTADAQTVAIVSTPVAIATALDDVYWIDNGANPAAVYSVYTPQARTGVSAGRIAAPFAGRRRVAPADHDNVLGLLTVNASYVIWSEQTTSTTSLIIRTDLSVP